MAKKKITDPGGKSDKRTDTGKKTVAVNAEEALLEAEEKYRLVADYTYDWEYWLSHERRYKYVSPSCERITGYTVKEFMDDHRLIEKIVHPDDLGKYNDHVSRRMNTDKACELEFRIVSKSGEVRWIGHVCRKIFINGKYLGIRVSNRDITEKIRAENELINITVEMEERERKRFSRELHDGLGPLLSTIKLYFQWLAETADEEKRKIIIERGNYNIERAIQTTREVSYGLSPLILTNLGYVDAVLDFIQGINETEKLNIHFSYNSNARLKDNIEINLYRITTQLIKNTMNYANATLVEIRYHYYSEKKIITLQYTDNGIGFDPATAEKNSKGHGLTNIRQRVKSFSGTMKIESAEGMGVKMYICLPVK